MEIKIQVRGIEKLQAYLKTVPRGAAKVAIKALGEWLVGNDAHGLKHQPAYKYVSRKAAGYKTSATKQMRYFFAVGILERHFSDIALRKYARTGATRYNWRAQETRGGYGMKITNPTKGAYYTMSDKGQARQMRMIGWRKASEVVRSNLAGAIRHARSTVAAFLKSR